MFAVTVTLEIAKGRMPEFLPAVLENARASLDEPACHRFDVWAEPERPDEVYLYELYDDAAGFDAHRATPHYRTFDAAVRDMIVDKTVRTYSRMQA